MNGPKIKASSDAEWRYYYETKCRDARKEITHLELQLEDAKRTNEVLKEQIRSMVVKPDEPTVPDLAMLVARLIYQVGRFDPGNDTAKKAMDYLRRKNLQQSVLRQAIGGA